MARVTDDERRRVAAALREYASFDCEDEDEEGCLVDCTDWGERVLNLLGCGDTEGECYAALADLIEPSCDRDALLALADELDSSASMLLKQNDLDPNRKRRGMRRAPALSLMAASGRIREACGMVDAG